MVLGQLDEAEKRKVRDRAEHVREVLTGYRSGSSEVARDDEPRPEYSPDRPLEARYAAKIAELGMGLRTLKKWIAGEQDPDLLAGLFKLDHLATRMRRNGENLLVLAGEEAGRRWSAPVRLVDVLRAATSEVEQYQRVHLRGLVTADVDGRAVNDIVHLIAELLENATAFSSPDTEVLVTSRLLSGGGATVEIQDSGMGMTAKDLEDANDRLLNPPVVDVSVARRMGMFVVGQLSGRHGIRVQLRRSSTRGITAVVRVPQRLVRAHGDHMDPPGLSASYDSEGRLTGWRNYDTTEQLNDSTLVERAHRTRRHSARSTSKEKGLPRI
ncbi:hypothetical protein GCM10010381_58170 [Streptomyces xantholiticus]|nr:hypothetical protein GCM10010381_58170 [Streptomyces xantholiticus]